MKCFSGNTWGNYCTSLHAGWTVFACFAVFVTSNAACSSFMARHVSAIGPLCLSVTLRLSQKEGKNDKEPSVHDRQRDQLLRWLDKATSVCLCL